jgi:TPP-dependent indolepyruvate ferredoxin oxidoreductase alpha subunit
VNLGFTPDQAVREGKRCLRCKTCNKCMEKFDCVAILPWKNNGKLSPRIDQDLCVGCQVCAQVCPYGSIHQKEM